MLVHRTKWSNLYLVLLTRSKGESCVAASRDVCGGLYDPLAGADGESTAREIETIGCVVGFVVKGNVDIISLALLKWSCIGEEWSQEQKSCRNFGEGKHCGLQELLGWEKSSSRVEKVG